MDNALDNDLSGEESSQAEMQRAGSDPELKISYYTS